MGLCYTEFSNLILSIIYHENGMLSLPNFIKKLNEKKYDEGEYLGGYLISNIYSEIIQKNCSYFDLFVTECNIINIDELDFNKFTILLFSTRLGIKNITYSSQAKNSTTRTY